MIFWTVLNAPFTFTLCKKKLFLEIIFDINLLLLTYLLAYKKWDTLIWQSMFMCTVLRNQSKSNFFLSVQDVPSPYRSTFNGPHAVTSVDGNGAYVQQNDKFFELKCTTSECSWSLMDQKLDVGRDSAVLMYLPADFECWFYTNKSSLILKLYKKKSFISLCTKKLNLTHSQDQN